MDPLTAFLNLGGKFLDFLCTPEGQKVAQANAALVQKIADRINKLHDKIAE